MSRLCRYAGGLACLVTVLALAACEAGPGSTTQADAKVIGNIAFQQGETIRRISLGDKFTGKDLTYSATSDKPSVATATVDNDADTLTVTAVGAGTATITVTAKNPKGEAKQSFTVTVPQPASEEEAPTVRTGAITSVDVAQGGTQTVTLSTVFDGANLSYAVSSSAVATASESNGTLTIRGFSIGSATVTVTATNTAGSSPAHAIAVTVTAPVTTIPAPPTTLTIKRGESAKRTLSAGQTLKSPDVTAVAVEPSGTGAGNVWIITAIKKGTYTITIFNGDGTSQSRGIVVVIPNSLPLRLHENPSGTLPNPVTIEVGFVNAGRFDTTGLILGTYFEDPDPDDNDDELRYKVGNKLPPWILMDAKTGFATVNPDGQLRFEVLEEQLPEDRTFTVTLHAVDDSGGTSQRPVVLELTARMGGPAKSNYTVRQAPNGDLNREGTLRVGPRMVSEYHTLTFQKAADDHSGFRFASLKAASLVKAGDLFVDDADVDTTATVANTYVDGNDVPKWVKADDTDPPAMGANVNSYYYLLKSSGDVEAKWHDDPVIDGNPTIYFRLTGTGRGTITIEYHVWKYTGSGELEGETKGNKADKATESISLDIVTCNSPPDPLSDCPGAPPSQ